MNKQRPTDSPSALNRREREISMMSLGVALPILERAYRAAANQAVAHVGISQAMAWPLVMVGRQGDGLRQGVLAELLGIEGPSLARSLDQLIAAGLIERREDPADRRAKTLHLSPAGAQACAQIEAALLDFRFALFEGVADADLQAALRVFAALQQRLGCPQPLVPPPRSPQP